jgi:hypothetical protein
MEVAVEASKDAEHYTIAEEGPTSTRGRNLGWVILL